MLSPLVALFSSSLATQFLQPVLLNHLWCMQMPQAFMALTMMDSHLFSDLFQLFYSSFKKGPVLPPHCPHLMPCL